MEKISAVYKITNEITGDFYIGSSRNVKQRWKSHRSRAFWKQHPNIKMYQDMQKYGLDNFEFVIIEETDNLKEKEQYFIDLLKPSYNSNRAIGFDDRIFKNYHDAHREKDNARMRKYNNTHRAEINNYYQRLCLYNGKTLTLNALKYKLSKLGFSHPVQEAKKYLIGN